MSPGDDKRRPARGGVPVERICLNDTSIIGVPCRVAEPGEGRKRWFAVVVTCPWCSDPHAHYSSAERLFGGVAVRRCSRTGHRYLLLAGEVPQ